MTHVDFEILGATMALLLTIWSSGKSLENRLTRLETLMEVVTKKVGLE